MSKVKIEGHGTGTGTFTVTTPSSNTDRTITLPDSTDTLAVNSDVTNKLPLAGGTMSGNLIVNASVNAAGSGTGGGFHFADGNAMIYRDTNDMVFKLQGAEKIRLPSSGGITFNGDTAAANALDDYEYGTWTPTFHLNHIGSHTLNYANYVKVGRLVTINMYVYNFGSIGGTGISFGITSLPFSQNVQALGVVTATHTDFHNSYGHAVARLYNGVAYIEQTKDAASGHWLDYSAFNANSHVQMSIAYETSV